MSASASGPRQARLLLLVAAAVGAALVIASMPPAPAAANSTAALGRHVPATSVVAGALVAAGGRGAYERLSVAVVGDWGLAGAGRDAVARQLAASPRSPSFVASLGDQFYPAGVEGDDPGRFRDEFEDVYLRRGPSLRVPWFVTMGNHDYRGDVEAEAAYARRTDTVWRYPARWYEVEAPLRRTAAGVPSSARVARFVFLDTDVLACEEPAAARHVRTHYDEERECRRHARNMVPGARARQVRWLMERVRDADANPRVATVVLVGHHPLVSNGVHSNAPAVHVPIVAAVAASAKVSVYLCGHEHVLEHDTIEIGEADAPPDHPALVQARWAAPSLAETSIYPRLEAPGMRFRDGAAAPPRRLLHQYLVGGGGGVMMYSPPLDNARDYRFAVPVPGAAAAAAGADAPPGVLARSSTVFLETCHGHAAVSVGEDDTVVTVTAYTGDVLYEDRVEHGTGKWESLRAVAPGEAPPQLKVKPAGHRR